MPYYPPTPQPDPNSGSGEYQIDFGDGILRTVYDLFTHPTLEEAGVDVVGVHGEAWEQMLSHPLLYGTVILPCNRLTLSGNLTLTADSPGYMFIDPADSNRDVTAPTEFAGLNYFIHNTGNGAEIITFKDSGGSSVGTIANNAWATFIYDGAAWRTYS